MNRHLTHRLLIGVASTVCLLGIGVITPIAANEPINGCKDSVECRGVNEPWEGRIGFCAYEPNNSCACDFSNGNGTDFEQQNFCRQPRID